MQKRARPWVAYLSGRSNKYCSIHKNWKVYLSTKEILADRRTHLYFAIWRSCINFWFYVALKIWCKWWIGAGAYIQGFLKQNWVQQSGLRQWLPCCNLCRPLYGAISRCGTRKAELWSGLLYRSLWSKTARSGFRFKLHYVIKERTWPAAPPLSVKEESKHKRNRVRNRRATPHSLPEVLVKQISGKLANCFQSPVW